jgi:hypothetical protein
LARKVLHRIGTATPGEDNAISECRSERVDGVMLLEKPADINSPKRIDCYAVKVQDFDGARANRRGARA